MLINLTFSGKAIASTVTSGSKRFFLGTAVLLTTEEKRNLLVGVLESTILL